MILLTSHPNQPTHLSLQPSQSGPYDAIAHGDDEQQHPRDRLSQCSQERCDDSRVVRPVSCSIESVIVEIPRGHLDHRQPNDSRDAVLEHQDVTPMEQVERKPDKGEASVKNAHGAVKLEERRHHARKVPAEGVEGGRVG